MSNFKGKDKGKQLPEWVQKTVQKSKLGFNRVHDELKRMYDESLTRITTEDSDTEQNVASTGSKTSGVINKVFRLMDNFKNTLSQHRSRKQRIRSKSTNSCVRPSNTVENVEDMVSAKKRGLLSTKCNQTETMPFSELLRSQVYFNDRVVHEQDECGHNVFGEESQELYADIDDCSPDDSSDTAESESQYWLDLGLKCSTRSRDKIHRSSEYEKLTFQGENEHCHCTLNTVRCCQNTNSCIPMCKSSVGSSTFENGSVRHKSNINDIPSNDKGLFGARKKQYVKLCRSLPAQLNSTAVNRMFKRSDSPNNASDSSDDAPSSRQCKGICRCDNNRKENTYVQSDQINKVIPEKHDLNNYDVIKVFYHYTVEEVVDCFKKCAFVRLAQVCLDERLDGEYFRDITEDDLKQEPFHMNWFHISKLIKVINGWRPKNSQRLD